MNDQELRSRLAIQSGQVTINTGLSPAIDDLLAGCYLNQPIQITQATPGTGDGTDGAVVITGVASFLNVLNLPVTLRAWLDAAGNAQLSLRYTLLSATPGPNDWKFKTSFPTLPTTLLDQFVLYNAAYLVTTEEQASSPEGVPLKPGINFISQLKPTSVLGLIENLVGNQQDLALYGSITLPKNPEVTTPLLPFQYPWMLSTEVPGINLTANLDAQMSLGSLRLDQTLLRVYSPTSADWLDENDTYAPLLGLSGTLQIPSADISVDLSATFQPGSTNMLLRGDFTGVSIGKLADLLDLSGPSDLSASLPDQLKQLGDQLGKLELMTTALLVSWTGSGFGLNAAYFTIGMPDLKWQVFGDHFVVDSLGCTFSITSPLRSPSVGITLFGQMAIEGVPVKVAANNLDGFTLYAQLAEKQTLPLQQLMQTYLPEIPAPSDLTIDTLSLTVAPGKSYAMAMTMAGQPNPWVIDVGFENLTVSDVALVFTYPQGGPVSGAFGGSIAFGDTFRLGMRYTIPGNFAVRGNFPEVKLSSLISTLCNQTISMPDGFDLTFLNSSVLIQKTGADYAFQFGTELQGFGLFALEVRKTGGSQWGFAAGLDIGAGGASSLPGLSAIQDFISMFGLQKLILVISSFDDTSFTFPDMAAFNTPTLAGGKLSLPGQGGVIAGFNFFGQWVIRTDDKQQNLLKQILGLNPTIGVTLQVGSDPSKDSRLYVSYNTQIDNHPLSCKFGGQYQNGSISLFLQGSMTFSIQGQNQTFDVELDFVPNGAFIAATMKGNTPINFEVFQLGNLALVIGITWEGIPSLGIAGTIVAGEFESSIAVFFDAAQPAQSLVAGALSDLTLKDVLDTLTGNVIPSDIDGILDQVAIKGTHTFTIPGTLSSDLDGLNIGSISAAFATKGVTIPASLDQVFFAVAEKGSAWFLTDLKNEMRHYQLKKQGDDIVVSLEAQFYCAPQRTQIGTLPAYDPGFFLTGALDIFGFNASATIDISPNKGLAVDAAMDKLVIGTESLFSLTSIDGQTGPRISAATFTQPDQTDPQFRPPHFYINGELHILGLTKITYAVLTTAGFEFEFGGTLVPMVTLDLKGHFNGFTNMGISGTVQVGIDTIDLGPLGKINIDTGVSGTVSISVSGSTIAASLAASFSFFGQSFSFSLDLDDNTASLKDLPSLVWAEVKKLLSDFLTDAKRWAEAVAKGLIQGVENVEQVLQDVFHQTADEAKQIVDDVWGVSKDACSVTSAALKL